MKTPRVVKGGRVHLALIHGARLTADACAGLTEVVKKEPM
jgi:hypothetical protein